MQPFELVLYDTEFTAWPGSAQRRWSQSWEAKEIIQLAAVKVRVQSSQVDIVASFNELIKPVINPKLSEYICELTGITQSMLDNMGIDFQSAVDQFHGFCNSGALPALAWGDDASILQLNCQLYQCAMPQFNGGLFNLHALAKRLNLPGHQVASGELAEYFEQPLQGHQHNALFDVRCLAIALQHWLASEALNVNQLLIRL